MYSPTPILIGQTPPTGLTLAVTGIRGGMAGYILLGQSGPPLTVQLLGPGPGAWFVPALPCTLLPGQSLRLIRLDPSLALSTLHALAPLDEGGEPESPFEPLTVTTDPDGYQTIPDADATTDPEGYQTIPDATPTTDPDGYESVERSQ